MKQLIFILAGAALLFTTTIAQAQPVAKADAIALLNELPAPPTDLAGAYQRAYANDATRADAKPYYQATTDQLKRIQQEAQNHLMQFYQQNPTGVPAMPKQGPSRVSAKDKSAMESATSELAQKMMSDKAFAQKFAQMSEAEQQAYIAKMLADKGLTPANGTPNAAISPIPGTDMDWMTPCSEFSQAAIATTRWEKQAALQEKYRTQHNAVNTWIETEIKKLPLISLGEYGHDYDPVKVSALKKQGLDKHRQIADAMMKEAAAMFTEFRQEAKIRSIPLNDALKKVNYGAAYSFGLNYSLVLQTQMTMLGDLQTILDNEINLIEEIARWEYDWRNFQ